jgi:hypothetical protein
VFALTITTLVLGFAAGMYAAISYLPPLAETREGVITTWTVRALIACATAWTAVEIYDLIHAYATFTFQLGNITRAELLNETVHSIFTLSGLLIAAAAIVYLLAPADDGPEPRES